MRFLPVVLSFVIGLFATSAFAQDGSGAGSGAAAEGSAEVVVTGPALGTTQMNAATGAVAQALEAQLVEAAPWSLGALFGIAVWRWCFCFFTVALFYVSRRPLMRLLMRLLKKMTSKTETTIDDELVAALDPPLGWFVMAFGYYVAFLWLGLEAGAQGFIDTVYRVSVIMIVGWALLRCVSILTAMLERMTAHTETQVDDNLVPLVGRVLRFALVAFMVVIVLQEVGLNVAGLVAGIGVGGLALALAAQDTVANWFGAIMIYTDRPFEIGDWIKTPDLEGVVEEIGLRSTRIRTFSKTVVSVPNSKLADAVIDNFSRMPKRRVNFKFGVTYSTTPAMMRETLERCKDILRNEPRVDQTFWLVKFTEFDASSMNILFYFFTNTTDWDEHLAIREDINLAIMDAIEAIGVQAAFPSTSIYMEKPDPAEIAKLDAEAKRLFAARGARRIDDHEAHTAPADADQ